MKLKDIPVVREFPDVFPDDFPSVLIEREIEFRINVLPMTQCILRAPHKMALIELKELKIRLQELLDKGFIRPSMSLRMHRFPLL